MEYYMFSILLYLGKKYHKVISFFLNTLLQTQV